MKTWFRQHGIFLILLLMKVLTVARTAQDTYTIEQDWLSVALIDGAYLAFWLIVAYAGSGQAAMAVRPFAAAFAWVMYAAMFYIGIEKVVLTASTPVGLIARLAGASLLLLDTWEYASLLLLKRQASGVSWQQSSRAGVSALAYLVGVVVSAPLVLVMQVGQAARDYWRDAHPPRPIEQKPVQAPSTTPVQLRVQSPEQRIRRVLMHTPEASKAEVARRTGLARGTVLKYWPHQEAELLNQNGRGENP